MKRLFILSAIGATLAFVPAAAAMTDTECVAVWTKVDVNKTGTVNELAARQYYAMLRVAGKPIADDKLTQAMFLEHCKSGLFNMAAMEPGAPLTGANSFTEGQAKDRIIAAGIGNVSVLVKDKQGVWRGTGSQGAANVKVAVDYKGNVVSE